MTKPILTLVPEPTVDGTGYVSTPPRIRALAAQFITDAEQLKRITSGLFTTENKVAEAKAILARWTP